MSNESFILVGDCREGLATLEAASVHVCVASPPYYGLRDYGVAGQIGLEASVDDYVTTLVEVFRDVRRVLRPDGTLWLNLGDSYSRSAAKGGSGPGGKNEERWDYGLAQSAKVGSSDGAVGPADRPGTRSKLGEKQLIGIPWRVAFALQADGWVLRQEIIWAKPNPMPESVKDRCTRAHETIFMFAVAPKYYYDADTVAEPAVCTKLPGRGMTNTKKTYGAQNGGNGGLLALRNRLNDEAAMRKQDQHGGGHAGFNARYAATKPALTRNRRSVWNIATRAYKGAHFATFPPALIEPCILAGCPVGGTVLDPFFGAGTTGLVAEQHGRFWIGCELNPEYAALAMTRITGTRK